MSANIERNNSGHSIDYRITGSKDEVEQEIKDIMETYPTPGYGTWFDTPRDLGNGQWESRGYRSTSCD